MLKNLQKLPTDGLADVAYGSDVQLLTDWIDTTNFVCIAGRGTSKSTVIIARRSLRCVRLMPGAPVAIVADSYSNLVNNIMPAVQNGWKLQGIIEGVHYVKGIRPPQNWRRKCSVIVDDYKYVYSFWNGSVLMLGSLDRPSLLAGKSVAHLIFDEAKYASDTRAARVLPILRGNAITYGSCHLYGGVTITTDMPDVTEGEFDWFFRYAGEMNPERIIKIVQAASVHNDYLLKQLRANSSRIPDQNKIARIEAKIAYYDNALRKLRKGQTFFVNLSSFANIDILTVDYAKRLYQGALEPQEFMKSVLGMRPGLKKSSRFYVLFGDEHKYYNGTTTGEAAFDSSQLCYLDADRPIDGGMDFGNMNSLVIAQDDGRLYRIHKSMYVLTPDYLRELADQFLEFFAPHRCRTLRLYFDRAANSYQKQGEDLAGKIKAAIEIDGSGRRTGWRVELMSRGQSTIRQDAEFHFMLDILGGHNDKLPTLRVDALNCVEMICSIEGAKQEIKYIRGRKLVAKVKRSEKMALKKLPRFSTNFSDAFKYLLMRREWLSAIRPKSMGNNISNADVERWAEKYFDV